MKYNRHSFAIARGFNRASSRSIRSVIASAGSLLMALSVASCSADSGAGSDASDVASMPDVAAPMDATLDEPVDDLVPPPPPTDAGCVPRVARGAENTDELCSNGLDDDCNGYIDCADFGCSRSTRVTVCSDAAVPRPDVVTSDAPVGPIGPTGGTVTLFRFGAFGDCRPPNPNETTAYPTALVRSVMQGLHDESAQFAVATGDYMFADYASSANAQLDLFLGAEALYGGYVFHAMGNHECNGATDGNCPNANETGNVQAYMTRLASAYRTPYFDWTIHTSLGDAHFIATAPNAWNAAQQSWLTSALARSATYTFVLAHEPPSGTTGPGSSAIENLVSTRPGGVTLRLYGHTHEYRRLGTNGVIDGNAGAPLASTTGSGSYYGFAIVSQRSDGNVVVTAFSAGATPMVTDSFVVTPSGSATR